MSIGVSGAGGELGRAVLRHLRSLPGTHRVIGISRAAKDVADADEARFGDFDAPETLPQAFAGLDRLLVIPTLDVRHGARARQVVAAIDGARAAGVGQVLLISDVGIRDEPEPHIDAASWAGEQHLMRSAPSWTILRTSYFVESFVQEVLLSQNVGHLVELGESRVAFVSRDDVAAAAAGILVGDGHAGAIYNATGPELLTIHERARLAEQVSGHPLGVLETTPEDLRRQLRLAGYPEEYFGIAEDTKLKTVAGGYEILTGDIARLTGRAPAALEHVLRVCLAPANPPHGGIK